MKTIARIVVTLVATIFYQSSGYAVTTSKAFNDSTSIGRNGAGGSIERKQLFDYSWKFFLGDVPEAKTKDFNDNNWRKLDLPHDWSIEGKINPKNPTGGAGGYFPAGIGWYRKAFQVPGEWDPALVSAL
ncbi:hypothetical protein QFZ51_001707 [Chitinophaga sp. W3I9]|uniref:hypothetical protein n=1 Tax=unclassified Chitinophaga TaxID=2619133 RepID=UPI003D21D220